MLDEYFRFYPSEMARTTGGAADNLFSGIFGAFANYYAQRLALEEKVT